MEYAALLQQRQSIRVFEPRPIAEDQLQQIMDSISLAPSAGNMQAYRVISATRDDLRQQLANAAYGDQQFLAIAPCILVFCADMPQSASRYGERGQTLYAVQDATIACTYAMLTATSLGIDSLWVGGFDESAVRQILSLLPELRPIALLALGYRQRGEDHWRPPRRSSDTWWVKA